MCQIVQDVGKLRFYCLKSQDVGKLKCQIVQVTLYIDASKILRCPCERKPDISHSEIITFIYHSASVNEKQVPSEPP